jgi:DNA polymerase-3 subunit gamma/tau
MASLAVKYRPQTFEECCGQESIIQILNRQLQLKQFGNAYLFAGPSGCGKTTLARIFARGINEGIGNPIEIDGASNNGVDNVKTIIQGAKERSLESKYKIYIIDECHMITVQGWNAFLKCIEEPPKYTIFIFCTTDPQKIPATILNRVIRFNLARVKTEYIKNRLEYICNIESYTNFTESCDYIAKMACGGVRDAIAMLEKCAGYSNDLTIDNVLQSLGNFSYKVMFNLTNYIIDGNEAEIIRTIDNCYNEGNDLRLFMNQYFDFVLDLSKFCIFKAIEITKIPSSMIEDVKYVTGIENNINYFNNLTEKLLVLVNSLRQDTMPRESITVNLLQFTRG